MGGRRERVMQHGLPPLRLAFLLTVLLAGLSFLPRVNTNPWLAGSFRGAAVVLLVLQLLLRRRVERTGRTLDYEFVPVKVHYVQATMQACVYGYWGWYWREVYDHVPYIVGQILFVYALDMLVCWWRRDKWILGFGPFPIVFSTNLFMWFRDEWFFLQFLMIATGVLGKEFVKWTRDGRLTHIFNPSAFSLFIFSVGLIVTGSTKITWGPEIAATLGLPPGIYLEVFLAGLVVQALFSVTLVTLAAAGTLCALNLLYTAATGTYHFIVINIPIAVFLGLHLLVTDPATSPRTTVGKIVFGAMYGASSFGLFGILGWLGLPTFYDKLLPVPILNLTVRWLDRASVALAERIRLLATVATWNPRRLNFASMAVWISLFAAMTTTGFLSQDHPGRNVEFWRRACEEGRLRGCQTWVRFLELSCRHDGDACDTLGRIVNEGRFVPRDPLEAAKNLARACDLGLDAGCENLKGLVLADGRDVLSHACESADASACFILGELRLIGYGLPLDEAVAFELFDRSCRWGSPRGCERLGDGYLLGQGTAVDAAKALESFEKACVRGSATGCSAAGSMYERGTGTLKNAVLAAQKLRQACRLGLGSACEQGRASRPELDPQSELLKLGG